MIFSMVTYGKGGWTWNDLYHNIPVFLCNFYMTEMTDAYKKEQEAMEPPTNKTVKREGGKTTIEPPVKPSRTK